MKPLRARLTSRLLSVVAVTLLLMPTQGLRAQPSEANSGALQAFMLTATYGVIAGSLTGLASLAFYETPSEHSRNIAMGASLGLYVGILLGAYVVYMPALKSAPSDDDEPETLDENPINLSFENRPLAPKPFRTTPWVNWDPKRGTQLGLVYNF